MKRVQIAVIEAARGAQVFLWEHAAAGVAEAYEVTTTSGYAATLPACFCDREPKVCRVTCADRQHCHAGFGARHAVHARAFAEEVAAIYGVPMAHGKSGPSTLRPLGSRKVRSLSPRAWADTEWARTMEAPIDVEDSYE